MDAWHELQSTHPTHVDVTDYEVESIFGECGESFFCGTGIGTVVGTTEDVDQQMPDLLFVVNDENSWLLSLSNFHSLKSLALSRQPWLAQRAFVAYLHFGKIPGFSLPNCTVGIFDAIDKNTFFERHPGVECLYVYDVAWSKATETLELFALTCSDVYT